MWRSLAVVSAETWNKVQLVERSYSLGACKRDELEHPEVIDDELLTLDSLAAQDGVSLGPGWQKEYWNTGYIHAIRSDEKQAVQGFLRVADDQLLRLVNVLRTPTNFTREGLRRKGIAGSLDREATEGLIEKCVRAACSAKGCLVARQVPPAISAT